MPCPINCCKFLLIYSTSDLCSNEETLRCLSKALPLSQALLCSLIDLVTMQIVFRGQCGVTLDPFQLSVTRHTPDVQLGTQDVAVRNVWRNRHVRRYLSQIGFMQIHDLVVFYKTSTNRSRTWRVFRVMSHFESRDSIPVAVDFDSIRWFQNFSIQDSSRVTRISNVTLSSRCQFWLESSQYKYFKSRLESRNFSNSLPAYESFRVIVNFDSV